MGLLMSDFRRVTVSLPSDVLEKLDHISSELGVSRSGFLSSLLTESIDPVHSAVQAFPKISSENRGKIPRRFRGSSAELIDDLVKILTSNGNRDLFK